MSLRTVAPVLLLVSLALAGCDSTETGNADRMQKALDAQKKGVVPTNKSVPAQVQGAPGANGGGEPRVTPGKTGTSGN